MQQISFKKGIQMGIKRERGMSILHPTYSSREYRACSSSLKKSVIKPKIELKSGIYCTPVTVMLILDTLYLPFQNICQDHVETKQMISVGNSRNIQEGEKLFFSKKYYHARTAETIVNSNSHGTHNTRKCPRYTGRYSLSQF